MRVRIASFIQGTGLWPLNVFGGILSTTAARNVSFQICHSVSIPLLSAIAVDSPNALREACKEIS